MNMPSTYPVEEVISPNALLLGPTCISLPVNGHTKHIPGRQRRACRICALLVVLHYARLRPASWPLDQQIEIWERHYLP